MIRARIGLTSLALLLYLWILCTPLVMTQAGGPVVDSVGGWTAAGSFHDSRHGAALVRLLDGRVLVAGGGPYLSGTATASAEIMDPATASWTFTGSMNVARRNPLACLLPDGRVFVAGGWNGNSGFSSAEIYDPATGTWSFAGFMARPGIVPGFLLPSGKVLLIHPGFAELFDPVTGQFAIQEQPALPPDFGPPMLLADGKVLLGAGAIYDPVTGTLSPVPSQGYLNTGAWSRLLPDGRALIRGTYRFSGSRPITTSSVYTESTNTITRAAPTTVGGDSLLSTGFVLIAGGVDPGFEYHHPVLYIPSSDQLIPLPAMNRNLATSFDAQTLLDDGRVLVIGQDATSSFSEVYTPPPYSNPSPVVDSLSANSPLSDADFISLDIRGSSFLPNSFVQLGSTTLVTLYLGSQHLVAFVPPALRPALDGGITVGNPAPGGSAIGGIPIGFVTPGEQVQFLALPQ